MSKVPSTVTAELGEKLKSKIDVAKFFAGFITLFIGFLLERGTFATPFSRVGIIMLITSLIFCIAAVLTYDHLLTPGKYWTALSEKERQEEQFQDRLYYYMVRAWRWLFAPALVFFVLGLLLVLGQELRISPPTLTYDFAGNSMLIVLLVAVLIPSAIAVAKWPPIRKRN